MEGWQITKGTMSDQNKSWRKSYNLNKSGMGKALRMRKVSRRYKQGEKQLDLSEQPHFKYYSNINKKSMSEAGKN